MDSRENNMSGVWPFQPCMITCIKTNKVTDDLCKALSKILRMQQRSDAPIQFDISSICSYPCYFNSITFYCIAGTCVFCISDEQRMR